MTTLPAAKNQTAVPHLVKTDSGSDIKVEHAVDSFSPAEDKAMRRRIDWRLVPALGLMYGCSLMDRTNLPNAAIAGLTRDLALNVGYRYSLINLTFFISYVVFQPPMTVLCRKIGPTMLLPGICLLWGIVVLGFGFVNNWQSMVGLRFALGFFEAGFFPGCVYVLSAWYTRYEVGRRYSVFYGIGGLLSALSGPLAYGLMQMEGIEGLRGWRWIFIMEGVITVAIALGGYLFMVRFPDQEMKRPSVRFLKAAECQHVIDKINKDRDDVQVEKFNMRKYLASGKDIEVWGFGLIFLCTTTVAYAFAFFLPIILRESLGFSVLASQCLGTPPYVLGMILMYLSAWVGDKYQTRAPIIIFNAVLSLIGLPILGFASNGSLRYFGIFIATAGTQANVPNTMSYQANNIRGQWKRAFCSASLTGLGGIGGIAGSLIFRSQDSPTYVPGMIGCIVATCIVIATSCLLTLYFRYMNKKADRGEVLINGLEGFRYTI
ncbi:phthalate transporter [Elsinoe ampelina]|uniref:Phthalate transporter n=1 Tax=Elsinoe ampelina TaxID=302913 RepID=A0A6A6G1Z3_9PEZI|nr:phthalate transporter [Elsinoe ampelina]